MSIQLMPSSHSDLTLSSMEEVQERQSCVQIPFCLPPPPAPLLSGKGHSSGIFRTGDLKVIEKVPFDI